MSVCTKFCDLPGMNSFRNGVKQKIKKLVFVKTVHKPDNNSNDHLA